MSMHRSERIVAMAERRIARQRAAVSLLATRSLPTQNSIAVLTTMESVLETLRRSRGLRLSQLFTQNRLLRALPPNDFNAIEPALEPMTFAQGNTIARPGDGPHRVYFVERGVVSMVGSLGDRHPEIAMVGREGVVGVDALVALQNSAFGYVAQDDCDMVATAPEVLRKAARDSDRLRDLLQKFWHTLLLQVSEAALSGGQPILQRLARWLLMYHERIDGDDITITHEAVAEMLNVRRAGVTDALHQLEGRHLLKSQRGRIQIMSRQGLIRLAGGTYGIAAKAIGQLFPEAAPADGQLPAAIAATL